MSTGLWDEKFETGVYLIDEEHKFLFENLNILEEINADSTMESEEKAQLLKVVIQNLQHYTQTHFVVEEEFMRVYGYLEVDEHLVEHTKFIKQINELLGLFKEGKFDLPSSMIVFLRDWLAHHIGKVDMKLGVFLKEAGQN